MTTSKATVGGLATAKEAAAFLRTTPAALAQGRYLGRGPEYVRHGKRVLYSWDALRDYVTANTVRPSGRPEVA
ncbi:DNA-binding protein [Nocardia sp. NPDC050412]|uniref:DNA-binding protein n=1 Tax=Nocardia sp. NPDC050412 TaxID=3364320 RepID=UPI0037B88917